MTQRRGFSQGTCKQSFYGAVTDRPHRYAYLVTSTPAEELAETFVELADAVTGEFDLDDFLNLLADRCVRLLDVSAVGLSLVDEAGRIHAVGASGTRAKRLAQLEDGPGPACCRAGAPVVVPELSVAALRWPEFTATATAAGFASVHAVPLRRGAQNLGVLQLFRTSVGELDKASDRIAHALADLATIGLLQVRALREQTDLAAQLQHALTSRVLIEQAKGVTGERLGIGMDDAFNTLRRYARSRNLRMTDLASAVVDGSFDTEVLTRPPD
jgi:transcriptional regulator with GAF, ATPase, and Fis domain